MTSPPENPRLDDFLDTWLERRDGQLRPSTLATYRGVVRNQLRPHLGSLRLSEIDRRAIERVYVRLLDSGGQDGEPLSPRTIQKIHSILKGAFNDARIDGLVTTNPGPSMPEGRSETRG